MNKYTYKGPVMEFDKCITHIWESETFALSEAKAKNNLAYQFKKITGRANNTKISLPGKIINVS
ncbi:MAG: hypothetical protein R3Y12_04260 [Clostridia bacterium]